VLNLFYALAVLLIVQGLISLREGFRFLSFVKDSIGKPPADYAPYVSIIAPCKGIDPGFAENIASLFRQQYPAYEIIFVVENLNDPAVAELIRQTDLHQGDEESTCEKITLVDSGKSEKCGQKIHNLIKGLERVSDNSEVFVFVDSDARPHGNWLRYLVAPLGSDPEIGATTGYRWFLPEVGGLASIFLSVWNGSIATTQGPHKRNFAWGGSMALARKTFDELKIKEAWAGTVSDDYQVTNTVKKAGKYIRYVPECLIASYDDSGIGRLLEFTTRQMIITRIYSPGIWRLAWFSNTLFNVTFYLGLILTALGACRGHSVLWTGSLLILIYFLGAWKGWLRYRAIRLLLARHKGELRRIAWAYVLLPPFMSLLWLYNMFASSLTNRITWRGVTYELRSPTETDIVSRSES
jgi:ceramide glucosyltransferase